MFFLYSCHFSYVYRNFYIHVYYRMLYIALYMFRIIFHRKIKIFFFKRYWTNILHVIMSARNMAESTSNVIAQIYLFLFFVWHAMYFDSMLYQWFNCKNIGPMFRRPFECFGKSLRQSSASHRSHYFD